MVSNTATRAAAALRALNTRNERRVASIGGTSPRTTPVRRYASGAPTRPAASVEATIERSVCGPNALSKPRPMICWTISTGIPTITDTTTTRQNTILDRASAARTSTGRPA